MLPNEFRKRYIASLPEDPPEFELHLDEFTEFPRSKIATLKIPEADREFLIVAGLPKETLQGFLFHLKDDAFFETLEDLCGLPPEYSRYRAIGQTENGDLVCIDESEGGRLVSLNHDSNHEVEYINSGIRAYAESLCLFNESWRDNTTHAGLEKIRALDAAAAAQSAYWWPRFTYAHEGRGGSGDLHADPE